MKSATQSIIFEDGRKSLHHIEPGMVQAILNMTFMPELVVEGDYMYLVYPEDGNGEAEVFVRKDGGKTKVASVINDPDVIDTIKEVKNLGNSVAVSLSMECKMLGISPGDKVRIRLEKVE